MFSQLYQHQDEENPINLRITNAGYVLMLLSICFVLVGISEDLLNLSIVGLTVLLSFLYLVTIFLRNKSPELSIRVEIPSTYVKAKQFTTVSLELISNSIRGVVVSLDYSSGIFSILKPKKSILIVGTKTRSSLILYTPRRGKEKINSLVLHFSGFPGLFHFETVIPVDIEIIVVPQPQRVALPWTMKQKIFNQFISEISVSRRGRGDNFLSLREFQFGDEIRNIHWKATAKWGKLISKEFEEPIQLRFLIVIDRSMLMAGPKFEFSLSAILELASVIRQSSHNCTILVHGDRYTWKYDLGVSPSSLNRLAIALHSIEPEGSSMNFESLNNYIIHHRLTDTVMIMISDLEKDSKLIKEGYTKLIDNVQRMLFFACSTIGFSDFSNMKGHEGQASLSEYFYKNIHLNSKIQYEYLRREKAYRGVLTSNKSKFHLIADYNTNILLELKGTLDQFGGTYRSQQMERIV